MWRITFLAGLLIAGFCLPAGHSAAATKLPPLVPFEEFQRFLKRAVGDGEATNLGSGGLFMATEQGIIIAWMEGTAKDKAGDALGDAILGEAREQLQSRCLKDTMQLSTIARQNLDGIRLLRQSLECSEWWTTGRGKFENWIVFEDGQRFQAFVTGASTGQAAVNKITEQMLHALVCYTQKAPPTPSNGEAFSDCFQIAAGGDRGAARLTGKKDASQSQDLRVLIEHGLALRVLIQRGFTAK